MQLNNEQGFLSIQALGVMYSLFAQMMLSNEDISSHTSKKATIELAKLFINNNYQFDIGIQDVAKNANAAPNYLSTIFHHQEGISTKQYLTKVRMEKARELLLTGRFKIKEVKLIRITNTCRHFFNFLLSAKVFQKQNTLFTIHSSLFTIHYSLFT